MARYRPPGGLSSRILDVIRDEVKSSRRRGPVSSDYYAKQANPKDGGYAKSNYVKGDGFRMTRLDEVSRELTIRARPATKAAKKKAVPRKAAAKKGAPRRAAAKKATARRRGGT